uniref:GDT1 family protein n=1 Tax=Paramoeba aestuarina TaxID=180227 RepID=A0A7S4P4K2_9EUKA|mmetsp:Transcript_36071/g.56458  ORF Transcript_36071/g.56458 Transcript_36071/m.56458 type:complete len:195 (+) Transcript_36071:50-634(+)
MTTENWFGTLSSFFFAIVLAIGSSVDNLAVGVSLGVSGQRLRPWVNFAIAGSNALGAFLASFGGLWMGEAIPTLAPLLAGVTFAFLSYSEFSSWYHHEESPLTKLAAEGVVIRLAVPMTLNNLAGGVAGGVAGVSPFVAALSVLVASAVMMWGGHRAGRWLGGTLPVDPCVVAGGIFAVLALTQFVDVITEVMG